MNTKTLEEAVSYFKQNQGFDRIMKKMKNKYQSFERETPGTIIIEKPTKMEREALSGFMKKDYSKNKNISISLKKFQTRLDETRFSGVTIKQILEEYFGEEIVSNKEQKIRKRQEFEVFINNIKKYCNYVETVETIDEISNRNADEIVKIKKEYHKDKENLERELIKAIRAIENLPENQESLPIFAAKVNGDPHSLDRNKLAGQFFLKFLILKENGQKIEEQNICKENNCIQNKTNKVDKNDIEKSENENGAKKRLEIVNKRKTKTTEEIAEIYYNNNVLIDEMSNMVLVRNLVALKNGHVHEGWQAFYNRHEAIQVTLYNLSQIDEISTKIDEYKYKNVKSNKVDETNIKIQNLDKCLIVENPGVFTNIIQDGRLKTIPIVCTYGQVKLAGLILLSKLVEAGMQLYYSGDIDPEGMQIADKLKQRFRNNITLVGFNEKTYKKNKSKVILSEIRLKKLEGLKDEKLKEIAKLLQQDKVAAYEELNIKELKEMVEKWR